MLTVVVEEVAMAPAEAKSLEEMQNPHHSGARRAARSLLPLLPLLPLLLLSNISK